MQVRRIVDNTSDNVWILFLILPETNTLVFEYVIRTLKQILTIDNLIIRFAFFPDKEEGTEDVNPIESGEVKIASVKHIAGQKLVCEPVHRVNIMNLCISDSVKYRNLSGDVNLRMDSDARLGASELRPSENGHAEVDSCRVDGIEPAVQLKFLCYTLGLSNSNHVKGELLKDTMVSEGIGLRQHLPVDRLVA